LVINAAVKSTGFAVAAKLGRISRKRLCVSADKGAIAWVVEGEKDAGRLAELGLVATTNPGGAGKYWSPDWAEYFRGLERAYVIPDNDDLGRKHAQLVAGVVATVVDDVRIVTLHGLDPKGDVSDWLDLGNDVGTLWKHAEAAPTWKRLTGEDEWDEPVPLPGARITRKFPLAVLGASAAYVAAVAEATATPVDLAAVSALGVVSTVAAGAVVVEPVVGWHEPVNIYTIALAAPGEGKTPASNTVAQPLDRIEQERQGRMAPEIIEAEGRKRMAESARKRLEEVAAKAGPVDRMAATADALDAAHFAAGIEVPACPRLYTLDATPEGLVRLLAEQGGRLAVLTDEGADFFELAGRYSATGKGNLGVYLKGWDGKRYVSDRAGRDPLVIEMTTLTVSLMAQPVVLSDLAKDRQARGRGLLARFLWSMPSTEVGKRPMQRPPVPAHLSTAWDSLVGSLADQAEGVTGAPLVLRLEADAKGIYDGWCSEHEPRLLANRGDLAGVVDWASKLPGNVLRLAGVLHAMHTKSLTGQIGTKTMSAALDLAAYFVDHACVVFGRMGVDEVTEDASLVLRWLAGRARSEVSTTDVARSKAWPADRTRAALTRLADYGWVRPVVPKPGPGRPSERWETYPRLPSEN